jgi:beta-lactamase class A
MVELAPLSEGLVRALGDMPPNHGFHARELDGGSREASHNPDRRFLLASVSKLGILLELLLRAQEGSLDLGSRLALRGGHRVGGSGVLLDLEPGIEPTLLDLATLMIVVSDNTASDLLLGLVGREAVNARCAGIGSEMRITMSYAEMMRLATGTSDFALQRDRADRCDYDLSSAAFDVSCAASGSPADVVKVVTALSEPGVLGAEGRGQALRMLRRQQLNGMVPRGLPDGVRVAHKTGGLTPPGAVLRSDAGVVEAPWGRYAYCICASGGSSEWSTESAVAGLAEEIYRTFAPA